MNYYNFPKLKYISGKTKIHFHHIKQASTKDIVGSTAGRVQSSHACGSTTIGRRKGSEGIRWSLDMTGLR
jgi:hypothetical protein